MELVQRAVFLELGDGSIDFLLQFLIVLVEAEGKVLDFGIRNIDDAECALAIGSYEVIGSRMPALAPPALSSMTISLE